MSGPAPRSLFVSSTAWSLIVLGVLMLLLALLTALLWLMLSAVGTEEVLADMPLFAILPPALQWLMRHLGVAALVLFVTGVAAIPLGTGLNRRREWARAASVWICVVLAVLHAIAVPWQWSQLAAWHASLTADLPSFIRDGIDSIYWPTQISSALMTLALAIALAWTARRLADPGVRAEFAVEQT
ncbi:MAG: hypothetical protein KA505_06730 [Xanthomonadales bacterium]|jgi:hypothetical protein|nr:hypothetical protein [Xanthomonadales bacterium]MBP6078484.1 hypothetical protein [Xanthomonadales bacterium]MBP7624043.1 hypothetical protein [Xanthomonadales bacterium]